MPRRSSGGRPAPRPARAPIRNPPAPVNSAPPPAPVQGGGGGSMLGGLGATIAQGMAFGTGSAVAHRAVDSLMGPRVVQHEAVESSSSSAPSTDSTPRGSNACSVQSKSFEDCLNYHGSDIGKCQFYLDMLQECRKGSGPSLGA